MTAHDAHLDHIKARTKTNNAMVRGGRRLPTGLTTAMVRCREHAPHWPRRDVVFMKLKTCVCF